MKKVSILLLVGALVFGAAMAAVANPWQKQTPFAEAVITYDLSGTEVGKETLYLRDHGEQKAQYRTSTTTMFGMTMKNETVIITTPDWVYSFNLQEQSGTKSINPQKLMLEEYNKLSAEEKKAVEENAKKMGASMMQGMQATVEANAREILGYPCDRTAAMGTTVYSIHETSIPLLTESNIMGVVMNSTAISVEEKGAEQRYFEFPQGIEPQPDPQADEMAKMIAEQTIAMLKDPEAFKKEHKPVMGPGGTVSPEDQQQMENAMNALKGLFGQ